MQHTNQNYIHVDMEVNDFAYFMFKKNVNDAIIELSLGGVENTKDLFCFLVDLLCKGLVISFGNNSNRIEIDDLTIDDFQVIKKKMGLAGIEVNLNLLPNIESLPPNVNIRDLDFLPDNDHLEKYIFRVVSFNIIYEIHFSITRPFQ